MGAMKQTLEEAAAFLFPKNELLQDRFMGAAVDGDVDQKAVFALARIAKGKSLDQHIGQVLDVLQMCGRKLDRACELTREGGDKGLEIVQEVASAAGRLLGLRILLGDATAQSTLSALDAPREQLDPVRFPKCQEPIAEELLAEQQATFFGWTPVLVKQEEAATVEAKP